MKSRPYPSFQEAIADLESKGKLTYFGRIGRHYEICLYSYVLNDGRRYDLNVYYDTGKVEIRE